MHELPPFPPFESAEGGSEPALLNSILSGIRSWKAEHAPSRVDPEVVKRRVGSKIDPYLGHPATGRILSAVSPACDDLLTNVEPVLALFLGCRAASSLVSHIVTGSLMG